MSVDDFGLEVLKKAAEEIVSGDKSEYVLITKKVTGASVAVEVTEMSSTPAQITIPANASRIYIKHITPPRTVHLGPDSTVSTSTGYPIENDIEYIIDDPDSNLELFGVASGGTFDIFVMGIIK